MKIRTFIPVLLAVLLSACRTTTDAISYFQDLDASDSRLVDADYALRLMPDDELSISVSAVDPQAVAVFNMPLSNYLEAGKTTVSATPVLHTYLIDADGMIDFPVLGRIKAAGKRRSELAEELRVALTPYVNDPIVTIQIRNFKVAVLGEVNKPGTLSVPHERLSLLDALGMAGDLTIYGNRRNVLLIRDEGDKHSFHRFDLTKAATLNSPYFYLKQNDVLVVEPNKARKGNAKYSQNGQFNVSLASTIISAVSVLASLTIALLVK